MLRLRPTTVRLTPSELKDIENRSRYRRYLRQQERDGPIFSGKIITREGNAVRAKNTVIEDVNPSVSDREEERRSNTGDDQSVEHEPTESDSGEMQELESSASEASSHHPPLRSVRRGVHFRHREESATESSTVAESANEDAVNANTSPNGLATIQQPGPPNLPPPFSTVPRAMSMPPGRLHREFDATNGFSGLMGPRSHDAVEGDTRPQSTPDRIMSAIRSLSIRATRGPRRRPPGYDDPDVNTMTAGEILAATLEIRPTTPQFPVYNDALPMTTQPQTPRHLPEFRHQSRFNGAYTAPAGRQHRYPVNDTPTRARGRRRERSPLGMRIPGFQGLYGGSENVEEDTDT